MMSSLARARVLGALLALAVFALGVFAGVRYADRARPGVSITLTATDQMPREIDRLGLTDSQRTAIQGALRRGRDRVMRSRQQIDVIMQSAVDSTDQEIRGLLTTAQRASFDSARRVNGPALRTRHVILHR